MGVKQDEHGDVEGVREKNRQKLTTNEGVGWVAATV